MWSCCEERNVQVKVQSSGPVHRLLHAKPIDPYPG